MGQSIASCVKNIIDRSPFISEMLIQDVISFSNLAKFIQPRVQQMYAGTASISAIVMAIRRYAEELKTRQSSGRSGKIDYEILMNPMPSYPSCRSSMRRSIRGRGTSSTSPSAPMR